ncbi:ankyrin [Rhizodiscina lignyota]|uniref:Ankyrin n=1 Tax=Rhizodiscina lignyota TaxID=1504668 RepID=A0A9P4MBI1_9PEZI|nr:ankyrin [Rhizodiscina lignyota]
MGLELNPDSTQQATGSTATAKPSSVNDLPPAAVELATKLFDAAREGSTALLSQYLDAGIPPNLTNHKGDTLIMLAAYHGHAPTVSALLARSADPNVLNDRGQSPVAGAVFKGYEGVVKVLVEGGADANMGQPSAVDAARMFRRTEMFDVLGVTEEQAREALPGQLPHGQS